MKIKGYVVRGTDDDGRPVCAARMADDERPTALVSSKSAEAHLFGSLSDAAAMCRSPMWNEDVRIYAVAEDGTETPLLTYEEALAQLAAIEAAIPSSIVATHTEHGAPMGLAARVRILAVEATCEVETAKELAAARAEIERLRGIVDLARRLIRSADLGSTSGTRAGITCDEEPYAALVAVFEAEREAERIIPGLVCAECDRPIYRGQKYGGKGGHAAHRACRNWPAGTVFRIAGAQEGPAS